MEGFSTSDASFVVAGLLLNLMMKLAELTKYRFDIRWVIYILLTLAGIGIFGNLAIISHFFHKHWKKIQKMSSYHFLLVLLALVDLILCIIVPYIYYYLWEPEWRLDQWTCEFGMNYILMGFQNMSFWLIIIISYERYRNIVRPFDGKTSRRKYTFVIVLMLAVCVGLSFLADWINPRKIIERKSHGGDSSFRTCHLNHHGIPQEKFQSSAGILAIFGFCPVLFMLFYYRKISKYMSRESKKAQNTGPVFAKIKKRNKRALKVLLLLLLLVFLLTVFPARSYMYMIMYFFRFKITMVLDGN